jgi:hypothetical protein
MDDDEVSEGYAASIFTVEDGESILLLKSINVY